MIVGMAPYDCHNFMKPLEILKQIVLTRHIDVMMLASSVTRPLIALLLSTFSVMLSPHK